VVPVQVNTGELKVRTDGPGSAEGFDAQAEFQDEKITGSGDDYTYSVRVRKTSGDGGLVIRFAKQDGGGSYLAWFLGVRHRASALLVWGGGGSFEIVCDFLFAAVAGRRSEKESWVWNVPMPFGANDS
jgi:hypothetical protein